jgi:phosphoserine phosphatase
MADDGARTWILTGSPENYAATAAHGFAAAGVSA